MKMRTEESKINIDQIPTELKERHQWVAWSGETKSNGKMSKIPISPRTGKPARINDPSTWGSFEAALEWCKRHQLQGIGFVFADTDPFTGIDLDQCIDEESGKLAAEAAAVVERFDSYTEISPSGKGLHLIVKGHLSEGGRRKDGIEIYDRNRFFTVTGDLLEGWHDQITDRQSIVEAFYQEHFAYPGSSKVIQLSPSPSAGGHAPVVQKGINPKSGEKFHRLWDGDYSGYPSQSEADLALCSALGFKTGANPREIDRLFRQSGLYRPKWDQPHGNRTYGQMTIERAMEGDSGRMGAFATAKLPQPEEPRFKLTDLGNAERLVHIYGKDIRYCHAWKRWLIWDGKRWAPDNADRIKQLAKKVVRSIYTEAQTINDTTERRDIARHAIRSESNRSITAMVSLAECEQSVPICPEDLDRNPWLFNCDNGTLDLQNGRLRGHRREDFITKHAPVEYNPDAAHPLWDQFLHRILAGNPELIDFMQRAVGYSLTGRTNEQCLFILHGSGANGKTTFLQAVGEVLAEYAMQTPTETLLVKGKGAISNDVARLKGARFVTASEAEAEQRLAENLIKQMTGGDTLSARFLHQEFFDFKPTHKLFLGTNHKPVIKGTDHAIWRRIRLIPFEVTIPEKERDPGMLDKLIGEAEGILAWAVEGCLRWRSEGLGIPAAVRKATEGYRSEMDVIARFLEDCCEQRGDFHTSSKDLYLALEEWCGQNGEDLVTRNLFTRRLKEMGFQEVRTGQRRIRSLKGLALVSR